jgi:glutaredoxin
MEKIKLYSTPTCPYCTELKGLLTKEGIEFKDINVN